MRTKRTGEGSTANGEISVGSWKASELESKWKANEQAVTDLVQQREWEARYLR